MPPEITIIDNKGLFYQKKTLYFILAGGLAVILIFLLILIAFLQYKTAVLELMPIELVYAIFIIYILNCLILFVVFWRFYSVEKKVFKIGSGGATQLTYYLKRIFPQSSHINWPEVTAFNVSGRARRRVIFLGSKIAKFFIYEEYQITGNNFDETAGEIRGFLIANDKKNLVQ